ncbi:MAG: DUF5119 domain-containing protein [Tannerella sp.]|jgi:hypothetical protein|nr:DUF5119 domain-containing protein [Tannerella sp.]
MRIKLKHFLALLLFSSFAMMSCIKEDLSNCIPAKAPASDKEYPVTVVIHWDSLGEAAKPADGMRAHFFLHENLAHEAIRADLPADGGDVLLQQGIDYYPVVYDYYGCENLAFRNENDRRTFEAYCLPTTGLYNQYVKPALDEATVMEPYPNPFYTEAYDSTFVTDGTKHDTIHFYPNDVVREFTFLVYGASGVKHLAKLYGAISGVPSAYLPALEIEGPSNATVFFNRVTAYAKGQSLSWPEAEEAYWKAGWQDPDTGWTGDWVMGRFSVFVPDTMNLRNRLTIEMHSVDNYYYYANFGGPANGGQDWNPSVSEQLLGAIRYGSEVWRVMNGGFDIILRCGPNEDGDDIKGGGNGDNIHIPENSGTNDGGEGGFEVDTGDYNNVGVEI